MPGLRWAVGESVAWVILAVAFGAVIAAARGSRPAGEYYAGYLLEESLSVDNLFAFSILFNVLSIPRNRQRTVLQWGIVGALTMRAGFIVAGITFIDRVSWAYYPLGLIVLAAGARMLRPARASRDRPLLAALERHLPVSAVSESDGFLVRRDGRLLATPLLVALIAIEATDLVFATDSIPAIFGVTSSAYVAFTSNAFAVMGLRALFFVIAEAMARFRYLPSAVALLLVLIGLKMLLRSVVEVPTPVNLALIVAVLVAALIASSLARRADGPAREIDDR